MVNQRLAVVPMEGNAIAVKPGADGNGHDLTIWVSTQMPHLFRTQAAGLFGLDDGARPRDRPARRRRASAARPGCSPSTPWRSEWPAARPAGDVGGDPLGEPGLDAARARPGGLLRAGLHARRRDHRHAGAGGRRRRGATPGSAAGSSIGPTFTMSPGVYHIPKVAFDAAVALTNTTPMGAFRGAGRPEATAHLERIMDIAAVELDVDPVELRRRNFIDPGAFPLHHGVRARSTTSATTTCRCARRCASSTTTRSARSRPPAGRRATRCSSASG